MFKRSLAVLFGISMALALYGCGGSDDSNPLAQYAGYYDVTEAFVTQTGNNCSTAPGDPVTNLLRVLVDDNKFEGRFQDRWTTVKGEIHEDGTFLSSASLGADQSVRFNGSFDEQNTLLGNLEHVQGAACTRTFSANGLPRE